MQWARSRPGVILTCHQAGTNWHRCQAEQELSAALSPPKNISQVSVGDPQSLEKPGQVSGAAETKKTPHAQLCRDESAMKSFSQEVLRVTSEGSHSCPRTCFGRAAGSCLSPGDKGSRQWVPSAQRKASPPTPTLHAHVSILARTKASWPRCKRGLFWRKGLILYFLAFVRAGKRTLQQVIQVAELLKATSRLFCILLSCTLTAGLFKRRKQK